MALVDFTEYKVAKQYLTDYPEILKAFQEFEKRLDSYAIYYPVFRVLSELQDARLLLSAHHNKALRIMTP